MSPNGSARAEPTNEKPALWSGKVREFSVMIFRSAEGKDYQRLAQRVFPSTSAEPPTAAAGSHGVCPCEVSSSRLPLLMTARATGTRRIISKMIDNISETGLSQNKLIVPCEMM